MGTLDRAGAPNAYCKPDKDTPNVRATSLCELPFFRRAFAPRRRVGVTFVPLYASPVREGAFTIYAFTILP